MNFEKNYLWFIQLISQFINILTIFDINNLWFYYIEFSLSDKDTLFCEIFICRVFNDSPKISNFLLLFLYFLWNTFNFKFELFNKFFLFFYIFLFKCYMFLLFYFFFYFYKIIFSFHVPFIWLSLFPKSKNCKFMIKVHWLWIVGRILIVRYREEEIFIKYYKLY